jgi:hypothetical protein
MSLSKDAIYNWGTLFLGTYKRWQPIKIQPTVCAIPRSWLLRLLDEKDVKNVIHWESEERSEDYSASNSSFDFSEESDHDSDDSAMNGSLVMRDE